MVAASFSSGGSLLPIGFIARFHGTEAGGGRLSTTAVKDWFRLAASAIFQLFDTVKNSGRRSELLPKEKAMGASAPKLPTSMHPQPLAGAPARGWGILAFSRKRLKF